MLLGRVLGELSQAAKINCLNVDSETDETVSSDSEVTGHNSYAMSSPELDLHLESERDFFNRLLTRRKELTGQPNSDTDPVGCPCSVSVPFKWEEKPGKPKHQDPQMSTVALRLPPVQKSNSVSRDTNLVSNYPRTLSERLRSILQPKLHTIKLYETSEAKGEVDPGKIALDVLHYPEEFQWRSLRNSSPISIFEGPDSSPSSCSSLSLLSYCSSNNRPLTSSSARHMQNYVPALLANRLIPVTEMLNAVPVDNSDSQFFKFLPVKGGDVGLPELCRVKSVKGDFSSNAKKINSQRSVSWGGAEFISRGQPKSVPSPVMKLKHCNTNVEVDNCSVSAAPVVLKCVSNRSASDPHSSNNSSIESAKSASSRGHCHSSQGIPKRSKHLDKVNKDFNDSHEEDSRQSQLIDSYEKKFKDVKLQQKRWHFSMPQRMNKVSCCSANASTTINCCSSRRATHTINCKGRRKNKVSLPKHQKLQMELRKLQEKDEIQK
ncbi:hypothetical protein SUGI_0173640 [Cryptomeria japonica]|uniref:uncharacterized protein LOC131078918 n=1 Tax=Cryptomeria japonica TaxID=3369 RepID=UPI0024089CA8|nr:uncharacterized protein LOC131078918 [Cryptomeria japonica]GLJ11650.1 hypothetical protein SUGI_0173640 [Cryptomeria japonica]